jgi:general secretion pathway protein E/type IV pilus assembly protein PilB
MDSIAQNSINITVDVQQLITPQQAWHYSIIPCKVENDKLEFFVTSAKNPELYKDELQLVLGRSVEFQFVTEESINIALNKYYRKHDLNRKVLKFSSKNSVLFLEKLIEEAKNLGSSDIHIEIYAEKARIRIRIDGVLVERYKLDKTEYPALINQIKIKSNLDIAEKRLPQDGRLSIKRPQSKIELRVSILPTLHGEKIVLRILSNDATEIDINTLGFDSRQLQDYLEGTKKHFGLILISGPTGSGKTTTLYATLKILNEEKRNILTIEDPIEYTLDGINQVQLKESIGLTFSKALKTFLRQDPDIIMLGEIRDAETAQMAVRAALTGHLVLSTIHTNSSWATISRLIEMGVPAYLLANTINISMAQRLVRTLCPKCKQLDQVDQTNKLPDKVKYAYPKEHYIPVGCDQCYFTGYKGRRAIYEVVPIGEELTDRIRNNEYSIGDYMNENKVKNLIDSAWQLYVEGVTSLEEIYPILIN